MRKQRLGQILGVLLLPYRDETFFDVNQDLIANLRYSFSKLKYRIELTTEELYHYTEMYEHSEKKVREFLREQMRENTYVVDDFRLLLDLFFPEEDIVEFYRSAAEEGNPGNVGIDYMYLRNIYRMAESLLTFRDGRVAIRTWNNGNGNDIFDYPNVFDKVEIWNLLSRMISPDLLIAAFYVIARHEEIWNLSGQSENIMLADLTLARVLQKGMADTHMHFNAGISFLHMWYVTMNPYRVYEELNGRYGYSVKRSDPSFQYVIYRIMWAEFLECQKGDFETYIEQTYPKHAHKIEELFCCILKGKDIVADRESLDTLFDLLGEWSHRYNSSEAFDFLGETVYTKYQKWNINSEVLFLLRSLWYFKENPTRVEYLHLFLQYVRCKNLYMSQIVQSNQIQGLDNFQMYYRMLRKREAGFGSFRKLYDCIFKSMLSNPYLEKMEIRLVPQLEEYVKIQPLNIEYVREEMCGQLAKQIYEVLSQYQKTVASLIHVVFEQTLEVKEVCDAFDKKLGRPIPMLGIVYHFHKRNFVDNRIADDCWVSKEAEHINTKHLLQWRYSMIVFAEMLEKMRSSIPRLNKFVVGLDAASNENQAEPWIFAPVYMRIRNRWITKPRLRSEDGELEYVNNIGFTFHVGEDFRHILSGLRHVDEVVQHFRYKAGDRLGHALALSVDVEEWTNENEVVVLPIIEYLEDLLWLWGKQVHENWNFMSSTEVLEGKILKLARDIEHDIHGMTVHMLYNAYQRKFSANYEGTFEKMREYICPSGNKQKCMLDLEHFCKNYDLDSVYGINWTEEKVFCTYFCPVFTARMQKPIMIHVDRSEIELFRMVQNNIIKEVEQKGIYVEVNPTSNLSIGEVPSFHSKHLLALNSKDLIEDNERSHEVLITINSDDPLIFNTNSENELAYVYHALTYQGYNKESVLRWIDKIRQMGLDSSFIKRSESTYEQLCEIAIVLEELKRAFPGIEL